jgi:hypothetical protein
MCNLYPIATKPPAKIIDLNLLKHARDAAYPYAGNRRA